ncbi:MAG TPA: PAS domain S-box protein [Geomonas sp.]|nr:PAS domain S-box protein [Geomonas sp.]
MCEPVNRARMYDGRQKKLALISAGIGLLSLAAWSLAMFRPDFQLGGAPCSGTLYLLFSCANVIFSYLVYQTAKRLSHVTHTSLLPQDKLAMAFASSPAAMVITSVGDGRFLEVNDSWLNIFGYRREEVIGRRSIDFDFWGEGERELVMDLFRNQRQLHNVELVLRRRSGERVVLLSSAELLNLPGEMLGVWSHVDITDRKRAEEELSRTRDELESGLAELTRELEVTYRTLQLELQERVGDLEKLTSKDQLIMRQSRFAAMGEMLGNIAHQWRQPLNILGLILQTLSLSGERGEVDQGRLKVDIEKSMRLIYHMSRTIDDFNSFLRPDKESSCFSLNEAVAAALSLFETTLNVIGVDLQVKERGVMMVEGHRNEFIQVIMNLLANAGDVFRERGTREPRLVIELARQDGRSVITIADNAGGIAGDDLERIFDCYFTTKGPDRGTGIGLFMSRDIIENHMKGLLTVRNTAEGAEFRIEI